ncbi:methionine synthase [Aliarcobacter butzleri]|uniref:Methionine synthase n=1 Tax=Aliarcobacter butzleri L351 TaxID=1447259 RepID=A0A837J883_9BACT|nr:methionine synthase [Aliarcobacter butzleri]KLE02831.1 5-methyltetrahydrofolate--homocysteine methyltransferase [Aliarcobacter butzleri L351]KLE13986.1 5-methyltetrahydrofolate--homocysteine methyltransferase [Aliarcobacter butzleri L350]MDN5047251.1 methionine synthase [Aliarcobacter butzleri]MDN5058571.1 methionine synthase [Aliarcobacter butzleri]MDN5109266.1 methionine synthase [Aliarcobacter butzleri]
MEELIKNLIDKRVLIIDGAMGTQLQIADIKKEEWFFEDLDLEGCNELLNLTAPHILETIHDNYAKAGADLISTNTFGSMPWVLDEYNIGHMSYELSKLGASLVKKSCEKFSTPEKPRFCLASIGPGTKLPSLGHIKYDEMYEGYKIMAKGLVDGGTDIFLLETCQDPLQIKAALHALNDVAPNIPIMVSVTIELSGTMLIGTDAMTIAAIMAPFNILSLGFNCGTGPVQVHKHVKTLSQVCKFPISVHSNAGLPQNRGGKTYYPMQPEEFTALQKEFLKINGVSFLGGCCGTTPEHIEALAKAVENEIPLKPCGFLKASLASLFNIVPLKQEPAPLLIGERSNATGSKAFRELLKANDYEGTLSVAQQQVRAGAHVIDVSVGFAGRDERFDMDEVVSLYSQKIALPLMPDSTQILALEAALKQIGGRCIINSVNLEDGIEKFDAVCSLAKKFGAALVCLVIDEIGMAKSKERKLEVAERIFDLCVNRHGFDPADLVFDMLTFTIGSGDDEYRTAGIETLEAIREFEIRHPEVGTTLGLSNISFGLATNARIYLNSIYLDHCVKAGLTSAIVNVKHILPLNKISEEDKKACDNLIFNIWENGADPLFAFIEHFSNVEGQEEQSDEEYQKLEPIEKVKKLLLDGDKERLIPLALELRHTISPEIIVNEWLIDGMKVIGELFGSGQMQLPFVLQSAETMKACVDSLNPYLPKQEKASETTLILGTVKGDVHDVGKNLVDIILSNNGFKVVNVGIKADLGQFVEELNKHNAHAIGMSGLLVKSTAVMKENLEELQKLGIKVPVLLGGAALTKNFVDEYCRTIYDGPIFYCRDAFDGVVSMQRIEKGDENNTALAADLIERIDTSDRVEKEEIEIPPYEEISMPERGKFVFPPIWDRVSKRGEKLNKELIFKWINHRVLFRQRWGYKRGKQTPEAFMKYERDVVEPTYEALKAELVDKDIFDPIAIYAYYPCISHDNKLYIFDKKYLFNSLEESKNVPPLSEAIKVLEFPRQKRKPFRCIPDFFANDRLDVVAFTLASAGLKITDYERSLYDNGEFTKYYQVHGLGVELAEALAEVLHKQIRLDLDIVPNEGHTLNDVQMKQYVGCRYSPGYAACPDLAMNRDIFDLLNPEEFGIELSETFQMHPEQTTCAIVVTNPEANYYNV